MPIASKRGVILVLIALVNIAIATTSFTLVVANAISKSTANTTAQQTLSLADAIAMIAASISVLGSTLAAGIALKAVASAGFAAVTERPELRAWMLIFAGLAEGLAIYGLLVAILLLSKI